MSDIRFEKIGGEWVDPPMLLPAAIPLELSGESIRSRLITSSDTPGEELALRPDLTLAIANEFIAAGAPGPVSYRYLGKAFRRPLQAGDTAEFTQTGFENFGHTDEIAKDVDTLSVICEEVSGAGIRDAQLYLGDVSIFYSVVAALELSDAWRDRLTRAFHRKEGVRAVLSADEAPQKHSVLAETLSALPRDQAAALLEEVMSVSGGESLGGRTQDEILERLQARAAAGREGPLPDRARAALTALLDISGPPVSFAARLKDLADEYSLDLSEVIDRIRAVFDALEKGNIPFWSQAHVSTEFGRRFDYYSGMVFEICHTGLSSRRPLATGGRYNGLVCHLSGGTYDVAAVGAVIRPDRMAKAIAIETGGQS